MDDEDYELWWASPAAAADESWDREEAMLAELGHDMPEPLATFDPWSAG